MRFGFHSIDSLAENKKHYFSIQSNSVMVLCGHADIAEGVAFTMMCLLDGMLEF